MSTLIERFSRFPLNFFFSFLGHITSWTEDGRDLRWRPLRRVDGGDDDATGSILVTNSGSQLMDAFLLTLFVLNLVIFGSSILVMLKM